KIVIAVTFLLASLAHSQTSAPVTLVVDVENLVLYHNDVEYRALATSPTIPPFTEAKNLDYHIGIGDVIAINGRPAKGTYISTFSQLNLRPEPVPGQAIGDVNRSNITSAFAFELLQADGTPIGTIVGSGLNGGTPPPGAPPGATLTNFAVTGGTGAFLGVRGQMGTIRGGARGTSGLEDPLNRRAHGGGGGTPQYVLQIFPTMVPAIASDATGPLAYHSSDFRPVTAANPAQPGELIILQATGLGPTKPGIVPGERFSGNPLQAVNSPVEVAVNGTRGEVVNAIGWPGTTDRYRIDVRLPAATPSGLAELQLTAAFVPGTVVRIPVGTARVP
ncbi:MAG TPA: hypothetical protein VEQ63_13125, partial [Bryobacteraceae bacterium]|nr:hypothetical protein [Bryobacteraceae bacterium]